MNIFLENSISLQLCLDFPWYRYQYHTMYAYCLRYKPLIFYIGYIKFWNQNVIVLLISWPCLYLRTTFRSHGIEVRIQSLLMYQALIRHLDYCKLCSACNFWILFGTQIPNLPITYPQVEWISPDSSATFLTTHAGTGKGYHWFHPSQGL